MVILITGATHTGKTRLAQKMMEVYGYPYLSEDHIKMGLIRSGYTNLTPADDEKMTDFLWPVIREIIKTAIENKQNLIVEGCYVPFNWQSDFSDAYLREIRFRCLCMSDRYIDTHFSDIRSHASCIESRLDDTYCTPDLIRRENRHYAAGCKAHGLDVIMIEENYAEAIQNACAL